jgi:hypothetical protein
VLVATTVNRGLALFSCSWTACLCMTSMLVLNIANLLVRNIAARHRLGVGMDRAVHLVRVPAFSCCTAGISMSR